MGLFDFLKSHPIQPPPAQAVNQSPISQIDVGKRYDVYCAVGNEDRLYENIRFIGIRTFERIYEWSPGFGGYFEIEAVDGSRMLISQHGIQLICEHGTKPTFKTLRTWGEHWEF